MPRTISRSWVLEKVSIHEEAKRIIRWQLFIDPVSFIMSICPRHLGTELTERQFRNVELVSKFSPPRSRLWNTSKWSLRWNRYSDIDRASGTVEKPSHRFAAAAAAATLTLSATRVVFPARIDYAAQRAATCDGWCRCCCVLFRQSTSEITGAFHRIWILTNHEDLAHRFPHVHVVLL